MDTRQKVHESTNKCDVSSVLVVIFTNKVSSHRLNILIKTRPSMCGDHLSVEKKDVYIRGWLNESPPLQG